MFLSNISSMAVTRAAGIAIGNPAAYLNADSAFSEAAQ
jgi:hypothetical protein